MIFLSFFYFLFIYLHISCFLILKMHEIEHNENQVFQELSQVCNDLVPSELTTRLSVDLHN